MPPAAQSLTIRPATDDDREVIARIRHAVYARELGQHAVNDSGRLSDPLDGHNTYLVAERGGELAGFVSVTPPGPWGYSVDKYLARSELPFPVDDRLYEVRLLTVLPRHRGGEVGGALSGLLVYAAFRWIESRGGTRVVAIGRQEVLGLYRRVGMRSLGRQIKSGAVVYELLTATVDELRDSLRRYTDALRRLEPEVDWRLGVPYRPAAACFHGGAFWDAVGEDFDRLDRAESVISADVLDAWFPPAPGVVAALRDRLPWLLQTSPPTHAEGLVRAIARARGVPPEAVLPGAGSSALIFLALRHWLTPAARALVLDPTYGEYAHVLDQVVGCRVGRLPLWRADGYALSPARLASALRTPYDLVVLVNPNSPTGRHVPRAELEAVLREVPSQTRVWMDEAYGEYAGPGESLERFAAGSRNVVVCKSLSKVYALSGARAAYLCGPPELIAELRALTPPYAVSLPAQVAAVAALADPDYYAERWAETRDLRAGLVAGLAGLGLTDAVPGVANFVLVHLPADGPDAATVVERCRGEGLFLRDAGTMGSRLGPRALRVAVKDGGTNRRIVEIIGEALNV
jgi:histidinol-phosphate/aromatic aminotransferase/cobyric acid decarboxylase-like protein